MIRRNARLVYPKERFHTVLQSSVSVDEFYGLDDLESKKLKIIQAKYGCRHCFHNLPDNVVLNLNKFYWNEELQCFVIDTGKQVSVRLNKLEETILEYHYDTQYFF
ncbi:MAG: hypothetical protein JXB34_00885 [Bacteroidales bacterium]|nr:hypothetical protein [Bacteroidales bacterium]